MALVRSSPAVSAYARLLNVWLAGFTISSEADSVDRPFAWLGPLRPFDPERVAEPDQCASEQQPAHEGNDIRDHYWRRKEEQCAEHEQGRSRAR